MACAAQVLAVTATNMRVGPTAVPHSRPMGTNSATARSTPTASAAQNAPAVYTPAYLQWAYDLSYLSATAGSGDTVAIVDAYDDPNASSDLAAFRAASGLPTLPACSPTVTRSCFEEVNQNGQSSPLPSAPPNNEIEAGWNLEESLDLDAVSSVCPLCKILLVEANSDDSGTSPDLETAAATAASLGANQISMSFGGDQIADETDAAADWSFGNASPLAAAGDDSYPGPPLNADTNFLGKNKDVVGYPASLPGVTAVGGTSLAAAANPRGFGESTWAIGPTNCSIQARLSNSCSGTESGCDLSQSTPGYQAGLSASVSACEAIATQVGQAYSGGRAYNDVSADADPNTGLEIYDSRAGYYGCGTSNHWCIVGGTSLATPLAAGFEAVTGTTGTTPQWAYSDASLLNDIVAGSDGTCPTGALLICNAASGWDGPTGNGSISGQVVTGAPGIGGSYETSLGPTSASLQAGLYPNSLGTKYQWEYGTSTSYGAAGSPTAPVSAGSGSRLASASVSLPDLQPCATYDYRLDATNSDGTVDGYNNDFTTPPSAPTNSVLPLVNGTPQVGSQLTATDGNWSQACGSSSFSYQWEQSPTGNAGTFTNISGATSSAYTPDAAATGDYVTVTVTDTNGGGSTTVPASNVMGPIVPAPATSTIVTTTATTGTTTATTPGLPPKMLVAPTVGGAAIVGAALAVSPGTYTNARAVTVRFYSCAHTCKLLRPGSAYRYRLLRADEGRYIRIVVTAQGATGTTPIVTTRWVGPIRAPGAGVVTIGAGANVAAVTTIRGTHQATLAHVLVVERAHRRLELSISRVGRAKTSAWAFVVTGGRVVSCSVSRMVRGHLTLALSALKHGQSLKLVSVRA